MAHVLVVDDRPGNRDLVATLLAYHGHRVAQACDGVEALRSVRTDRPDLVITDILMPDLDGYELVRELRADPATAAIPVVFYTANYLYSEIAAVAEQLGVVATVAKGTDPGELLAAVNIALSALPKQLPTPHDDTLIREHLRTVNAKLIRTIRELEAQTQQLRQSEERFRLMAECAPVGIVLGDPQGQAWHVNARLADIVGHPVGELLGGGWREYAGVADWHPNLDPAGPPARCRTRINHPDGGERWLEVSLAPLTDEDGAVSGTVGAVDDVTATVQAEQRRKDLEARARIAERLEALGRLAGGVAHDFNNILAAILAYTRFAHETVGLSTDGAGLTHDAAQQVLTDLDHVLDAGNRAAKLTTQLLAFGRPAPVTECAADVNLVTREVSDMLAHTLGDHIELSLNCCAQPVHAAIDDSELSQVVLNLAINARDAMPEGGQLNITTTVENVVQPQALPDQELPAGQYAKLTIADTGHGIPPNVLAHIFEPFYTTKPKGQGTGLGMSTVNAAVRKAHGYLAIASTPNAGTTIDIYLPASQASVTDTRVELPEHLTTTTGTILVVDDDQAICEIASRILTVAGYSVHTARTAADAIEKVANLPTAPDLLITDIVMPRMSGRELANRLLEHHPGLPSLYITGHPGDTPGDLRPIEAILTKPFTTIELLNAVYRLLASVGQPGPA